MCLRAPKALPSVRPGSGGLLTDGLVCVMSRMFGVLIASLGAFTLSLAANEASAGSQGRFHASFASTSHRPLAHRPHHHHRSQDALVWPGFDDGFHGAGAQDAPLASGPAGGAYPTPEIIPWDWAHRFPPMVARSDKPYVMTCPTETVTVPDGRGGQGQVNVTRCY